MIGTKIDLSHSDPAKDLGEVTVLDGSQIMDVALAVDGTEYMTKETIEKLGWVAVQDRGMSENNGYMFYGPNNWVLRFWTVAPRFELSFKNTVAFDSGVDPVDIHKKRPIGELKELMLKHNIEKKSVWMSHQEYLIEKAYIDKKTSELIQEKTGWLK